MFVRVSDTYARSFSEMGTYVDLILLERSLHSCLFRFTLSRTCFLEPWIELSQPLRTPPRPQSLPSSSFQCVRGFTQKRKKLSIDRGAVENLRFLRKFRFHRKINFNSLRDQYMPNTPRELEKALDG